MLQVVALGPGLLESPPILPAGASRTFQPVDSLQHVLGSLGKGGSNFDVTPVRGPPFLLAAMHIRVGLGVAVAKRQTAEPPTGHSIFPSLVGDYPAPAPSPLVVTVPLEPSGHTTSCSSTLLG